MSFREFEDLLDEVADRLLDGDDAPHDDVLATATASGLERLGLLTTVDEDGEDDSEEVAAREATGKSIVSMAHKWFRKRRVLKAAEKLEKSKGGTKRAPILTPARRRKQHRTVLMSGANSSGAVKLRQLEMYKRLHRSYKAGKLHKCLLSYFLLVSTGDRRKMLRWMGSSMVKESEVPMPELDELQTIWLRLAKIPAAYKVLADKGFADTGRDYPWFNLIETPTRLAASKGYRKAPGHIKRDRPQTSSRFSAETVFKRVYEEDALQGKIPYYMIPLLPYAHLLGHGEANLRQPFRRPGENSIVGDDYWENVKEYARR